ncbi:GNAT family N-acetyltransferase [Halobacillus sp. BAB-2008]|uniref:GNAT family N-acetyltransferase n=2 Tax=unclassified Halobacillus TaxID=2636472 RepID=UPI0002A50A89|nr:GNAT family N-acetyltransferase [Halobacillus sp. BAB-2008]ELK46603.1 acetyltransferase [Halobacillus sp. BAB-2008]
MNIHQATMEEVEAAAVLFDQYRQFYKQDPDLEGAKAYIEQRMTRKDSVIFLVKEKDNYVGFTQLYPTHSSISMRNAWILNDLYVIPAARGKGIGELLLNKAKDFAKDTRAVSLSLSTAFDNYTAQKLYEKKGYSKEADFFHYSLPLDEAATIQNPR